MAAIESSKERSRTMKAKVEVEAKTGQMSEDGRRVTEDRLGTGDSELRTRNQEPRISHVIV
jgi:hypothetical protein